MLVVHNCVKAQQIELHQSCDWTVNIVSVKAHYIMHSLDSSHMDCGNWLANRCSQQAESSSIGQRKQQSSSHLSFIGQTFRYCTLTLSCFFCYFRPIPAQTPVTLSATFSSKPQHQFNLLHMIPPLSSLLLPKPTLFFQRH